MVFLLERDLRTHLRDSEHFVQGLRCPYRADTACDWVSCAKSTCEDDRGRREAHYTALRRHKRLVHSSASLICYDCKQWVTAAHSPEHAVRRANFFVDFFKTIPPASDQTHLRTILPRTPAVKFPVNEVEKMTPSDLASWVMGKGLKMEVARKLEEEEIDGDAFLLMSPDKLTSLDLKAGVKWKLEAFLKSIYHPNFI